MSTEAPALAARERRFVAPTALRALVRRSELWLAVLGCVSGCLAALFVYAMSETAQLLHEVLFGIQSGDRLSAVYRIPERWSILAPAAGGFLLVVVTWLYRRYRTNTPVDPIEANALHGGRMSFLDSLCIAVQTTISNGFGASVGLEAGYAQIGSGTASWIGDFFRLRRNDVRIMVAAGAAGAIGAAFNAPLAGAFYAFELILGTYTLTAFPPVALASIAGVLTMGFMTDPAHEITVFSSFDPDPASLVAVALLALVSSGLGILIMRGVTTVEELFRLSRVPVWARPILGGVIVGLMALITPRILSSGHGAIILVLDTSLPELRAILFLLVFKALASAISLGSGFRGGLFFASLFLGALLGKAYAATLNLIDPAVALDAQIAAVVGMTGLAVAIVGGPLTMTFLTLEMTANLPLTLVVLVTSVISSITVRRLFGYSFTTWRFHLRGEAIRSAHDVGWIFDLTVRRLMRPDVRTVRDDMTIEQFRREFPLGATQRVVVVDEEEQYRGIVMVAEAHNVSESEETRAKTIASLLRNQNAVLLPWMNIKEAAQRFDETESEALAVIDGMATKKVVGLLTEAHTLRRYTEELEKARRNLAGDI